MSSQSPDEPIVVVSIDTHVGPRLVEDLRPYCPSGLSTISTGYAAAVVANRAGR